MYLLELLFLIVFVFIYFMINRKWDLLILELFVLDIGRFVLVYNDKTLPFAILFPSV